MTRHGTVLTLLVSLAALLGAPSMALGAPPNQLVEPAVSPAIGTTTTSFQLSVRYLSSAENAATAVTAEVAGLTLPLTLVSGSAVDGRWSVSSLLPAGTWRATFRAVATEGPSPSLAGVTVGVLLAEAPTPIPIGATSKGPSPSPALAPADGQPGAATSTPLTRAGPSASPSAATPAPAPGGGGGTGPAAASAAPVSAAPAPEGSGAPSSAAALPVHSDVPVAEGESSPAGVPGVADEPVDHTLVLLLAALLGVASVALLGTGWMLASRDNDENDPPVGLRRPGASSPPDRWQAAATAARRTRQRAALSADSDPILASLGLNKPDGADAPRRGKARGVSSRSRPGRRD